MPGSVVLIRYDMLEYGIVHYYISTAAATSSIG